MPILPIRGIMIVMTDEPTHAEVHDEDNLPATKGDVRNSQEELARMLASSFANVATKDDLTAFATKDDLTAFATKDDLTAFATKDDLKTFKDEIVREFKVVTENIHRDVAGVNADEISLLKDQQATHEQRIDALERA